jgi:hypothetical protein
LGSDCRDCARVWPRSGSATSSEEPVAWADTSCLSEPIQESTALVSWVSGSSVAAALSRAMMENRESGKASRTARMSARTPSSLVEADWSTPSGPWPW